MFRSTAAACVALLASISITYDKTELARRVHHVYAMNDTIPAPRQQKQTSGFACMECGHKFRTVKAAERAAFGENGCPKCGGSDIDLSSPAAKVSS